MQIVKRDSFLLKAKYVNDDDVFVL